MTQPAISGSFICLVADLDHRPIATFSYHLLAAGDERNHLLVGHLVQGLLLNVIGLLRKEPGGIEHLACG
jgi:hypothetical protein